MEDKTHRIAQEFIELLRVDSLSLHEEELAEKLKDKLLDLGLAVTQDDAGVRLGSKEGNLIARKSGDPARGSIMLCAHMDTVSPGKNKKPVLENGAFHSDGTTILGADNIAAVEIILEALRAIDENGIAHGDITVVFSVAEELCTAGARQLDFSTLDADYVFVLDCPGDVGTVAAKAPSHCNVDFTVKGMPAHAGIDPEKGISAVAVAAQAVSKMRLGRIDEETTANIGMISGGEARNIIPGSVELQGEIRSFSSSKIERQYSDMCRCFEKAVQSSGGSYEARIENNFRALAIAPDEPIALKFNQAVRECGLEPHYIETCGGSDANIFFDKGYHVLNIGIGMRNMHTTAEMIALSDMTKSVELLINLIGAG